jgi:hypothetical protein
MFQRNSPATVRDRRVGRLTLISRGSPIVAAVAVVGFGAAAAISYPGKSSAADTSAPGANSQVAGTTAAPLDTSGNAAATDQTAGGAVPTLTPPTAAPTPVPITVGGGGHVSSGGS